jgi:hypothetical protein
MNFHSNIKFEHAGIENFTEILEAHEQLKSPFKISSRDFLLPFNPVVSSSAQLVRIAFFGLNAYCDDGDFAENQKQRNFAEECQDHYNPKLFNVMNLWREGICSALKLDGAIYYTNFIKVVLRESCFKKASDVDLALKHYPACTKLFEDMARKELIRLKQDGCVKFVCFGDSVFWRMQQVAKELDIQLVHERHFSRYSIKHTERLIAENRSN